MASMPASVRLAVTNRLKPSMGRTRRLILLNPVVEPAPAAVAREAPQLAVLFHVPQRARITAKSA